MMIARSNRQTAVRQANTHETCDPTACLNSRDDMIADRPRVRDRDECIETLPNMYFHSGKHFHPPSAVKFEDFKKEPYRKKSVLCTNLLSLLVAAVSCILSASMVASASALMPMTSARNSAS